MEDNRTNASGEQIAGREERTRDVALLDVGAVAALLGCSERHVSRLATSGRMPAPLRLGALVRWSSEAVTAWIQAGCPAVSPDEKAKGGRNASRS